MRFFNKSATKIMKTQNSTNSKKVLKAAVIGCGRISVMHLDAISRLDDVELVACCDIDLQKATLAAEKYGAKAYASYEEMFEKEDLDAVHICLPHYLHAPVSQYAIKKGVNVLCEKPMTISLADAEETVRLAKENNVNYAIIFQCRYNAASKLVKMRAEEGKNGGKLGKILCASSTLTWSRSDDYYSSSDWKGTWDKEGGGVVIDQAIHSIDLVNWIISSPVKDLSVVMSNRGHKKVNVEDAAEGMITYENGVRYCFWCTNNFSIDEPIEIKLVFEHGKAVFSYDYATIYYEDGTKETIEKDEDVKVVEGGKDYWGFRHAEQVEKYYDALKGNRPLDLSGEEVLKTHSLITKIYEVGKQHFIK